MPRAFEPNLTYPKLVNLFSQNLAIDFPYDFALRVTNWNGLVWNRSCFQANGGGGGEPDGEDGEAAEDSDDDDSDDDGFKITIDHDKIDEAKTTYQVLPRGKTNANVQIFF